MPALSWDKIAKRLGISRSSLKRFRKEPSFPKTRSLKVLSAWLKKNPSDRGPDRGSRKPKKAKARKKKAARPPTGRSDAAHAAAGENGVALTLREQKLVADIKKIEQQLTEKRQEILDEVWEDTMTRLRKMMQPLKDALKKCRLTDAQARKVSKALAQISKELEPS